jgi:hypothetical protein
LYFRMQRLLSCVQSTVGVKPVELMWELAHNVQLNCQQRAGGGRGECWGNNSWWDGRRTHFVHRLYTYVILCHTACFVRLTVRNYCCFFWIGVYVMRMAHNVASNVRMVDESELEWMWKGAFVAQVRKCPQGATLLAPSLCCYIVSAIKKKTKDAGISIWPCALYISVLATNMLPFATFFYSLVWGVFFWVCWLRTGNALGLRFAPWRGPHRQQLDLNHGDGLWP